MQDRVGETFDGTVSGVTHFGLFVTLDGLNIDGLVHVTELGSDYFHFDAIHHALVGERSGKTWRLADRITVKVARVDLEQTKIDFVLPDAPPPDRRRTRPKRTEEEARQGDVMARVDLVIRLPTSPRRRSRSWRAWLKPTRSLRLSAASTQAFRLSPAQRARRRSRACIEAGIDFGFVPQRPTPRPRAAGGDGHGFDADQHRVHRRDRRHAGHQAGDRRDHRERDARRNRFPREPDAPRRAARGAARLPRCSASTTSGSRLSPGAERMLAGFARVGAQDAPGFRRLHLLHRAAEGRGSASTMHVASTLEIADGRLTGRISRRRSSTVRRRQRRSRVSGASSDGDDGLIVAIGDGANDLPMLRACGRQRRVPRQADRTGGDDVRDRPLRTGRRFSTLFT